MDYDGDGDLDVVTGSDDCCNRRGEFFLFRRGADGQFRAREAIPTQEEGFPLLTRVRVYVADWDNDGRLDLIVGKGHEVKVAGRIGRIVGGESRDTITTKPNVADWDGNGRPDLLVVIARRPAGPAGDGIYLLRGVDDAEGARRLAAPERLIPAPDDARFSGLHVADWDGDGVLDLIVGLTWSWRERVEGKVSRWKSRSQVWVYRRIPPD